MATLGTMVPANRQMNRTDRAGERRFIAVEGSLTLQCSRRTTAFTRVGGQWLDGPRRAPQGRCWKGLVNLAQGSAGVAYWLLACASNRDSDDRSWSVPLAGASRRAEVRARDVERLPKLAAGAWYRLVALVRLSFSLSV